MIVIFGAGNHALEAYNVLNDLGYKDNIFYYEENPNNHGRVHGYSTIIDIQALNRKVIGVLGVGMPHRTYIDRIERYVDRWMTVVHPSAHFCNDVMLGKAAVIKQRAILMPYSKIGNYVQVNVNALIGHHAEIRDYSCISPSAQIMGNVIIGSECNIGAAAVIIEKINIADRVTIGAGAVVIRSITEPGTTWAGVPAKKIKCSP